MKYYLLYTSVLILSVPVCATDDDQKPAKKKEPLQLKPLLMPRQPSSKALVTPAEMQREDDMQYPVPQQKPHYVGLQMPHNAPIWLFESALEHAPALIKGICYYLKHYAHTQRVPSYHRLILVGKPGTGKTTLARAIAWHLGYPIHFVNASRLFGKYRNETAVKMRAMFNQFIDVKQPAIILIDELHKLFELHGNEHSDDSVNAASFWLALDEIEQVAPHLIVIGTANSVDSLPPEIKSRFQGKVVTIPLPSKKQRIDAFLQMLKHDKSVRVGKTVNRAYISSLLDTLQDQALRDIQLLIDTATMCKYAEHPTDMPLVLERKHFELALAQLKGEALVLQARWSATWIPRLKNAALVLSIVANIGTLIHMIHDGSQYVKGSGGTRKA